MRGPLNPTSPLERGERKRGKKKMLWGPEGFKQNLMRKDVVYYIELFLYIWCAGLGGRGEPWAGLGPAWASSTGAQLHEGIHPGRMGWVRWRFPAAQP